MTLEIIEGLLYGALGTIIGLGIGVWINHWLITGVLQLHYARHVDGRHRVRPDRC